MPDERRTLAAVMLAAVMLAVSLAGPSACSTAAPAKQANAPATSPALSDNPTTQPTTGGGQSLSDEKPGNPAAITATSPLPARSTPSSNSPACRPDPHDGVYNPQRLEVIDPCAKVSGTVRYAEGEADGDTHIGLDVNPEFAPYLNIWNHIFQQGQLLIEIVPVDRGRGVTTPAPGTHVTVVGPYVLDRAHGWMEIHPVWAITRAVNKP
jgi:hypothetical protein